MKHFWYLICIIFPLHGAAQINIRIDYDNTSKEITYFSRMKQIKFLNLYLQRELFTSMSLLFHSYIKIRMAISFVVEKGLFMMTNIIIII